MSSNNKLHPLEGMKICITGALERGTRENYIQFIESQGGSYTNSVGPSTDYLVTNDSDTGTVKNEKARKYGVPIIDESDLHRMIVEMEKIQIWKDIVNKK